jgi:hypothetical protein
MSRKCRDIDYNLNFVLWVYSTLDKIGLSPVRNMIQGAIGDMKLNHCPCPGL